MPALGVERLDMAAVTAALFPLTREHVVPANPAELDDLHFQRRRIAIFIPLVSPLLFPRIPEFCYPAADSKGNSWVAGAIQFEGTFPAMQQRATPV